MIRIPQRIHSPLWRALLLAALLFVAAPALAVRTVLVFGDSLSAAYNLSADEGWVHVLAKRIERERLPWRVVNASVSGETTTGGLRRIAEDLRRHKPDLVLIELGANDALRGQPVAGMRENLHRIVRAVRDSRAQPVIVGMMLPPNYGIEYTAQFRRMFASLAEAERAPLVPFLLEGIADKPDLFQADQLHPTAQAQPAIADNVWRVVGPLLRKAR